MMSKPSKHVENHVSNVLPDNHIISILLDSFIALVTNNLSPVSSLFVLNADIYNLFDPLEEDSGINNQNCISYNNNTVQNTDIDVTDNNDHNRILNSKLRSRVFNSDENPVSFTIATFK